MKTFRQILESTDPRGIVTVGKVKLNTANDFQRQILNQSEPNRSSKDPETGVTYYGGSGLKNPLTTKEIQKIYSASKPYWEQGGATYKPGDKNVKIELSYMARESKPYYSSWSFGGWVGSTKGFKNPKQAIEAGIENLKAAIVKRGL
jgi:hypothetical protein